MKEYIIQLTLKSDTTFSRGDGVAGLLDREVEHDQFGLPYLHGRTLKGLLGEEADNLLEAAQAINPQRDLSAWLEARNSVFGTHGSRQATAAKLHFSHAQLPKDVRKTVRLTLKADDNFLTPDDVLSSLTAVRRQTAVNGDGIPHDGSLRSMRVILRETQFYAQLNSPEDLTEKEEAILAAAVLALRRAGTGRNRGRGYLQADLLDNTGTSILEAGYQVFQGAFT
ncbi:MAG: hypothetical protein KC443_20570 [Anaerolineales bacterium]|nr:hypothetical protein [Anaerolineales bacterium]